MVCTENISSLDDIKLDEKINVCIMYANEHAYSETFIRDQIQHLPEKVFPLYGAWFPFLEPGRKHILSRNLFLRFTRRIRRDLLGVPQTQLMHEGLCKYLKKNRIDVVLANYGPTGVAVMQCCAEEEIPLVVHFHGFDAWDNEILEKYSIGYKQLFQTAKTIIVGSEDMKRQMISLGSPPEKVVWNFCGVNTDFFSPTALNHCTNDFISVARFAPTKAPHLTLKAFSEVVKDFPAVTMTMIGDGELFKPCQDLVKQLGIQNSVRLLGALPPEKVRDNLRTSRIFVQHSIRTKSGDAEGSVISALEACSTQLPVVATRHGGLKESIVEGETGFLVDEGDVSGMAESMKRLLQDQPLCLEMGKKGRERMKELFDLSKSIEKLDQILREASGTPQRRPGD
jgi:colanic acid/amylovoran biosynthesis glycosyltransferase